MRRFRAEQFPRLPDKFRAPMADRYRAEFEASGIAAANRFLLDTIEKVGGASWRISAADDELCTWAKNRAQDFSRMAARIADKEAAFLVLSEACKRLGIEPPRIRPPRECTIAGAISRLSDEQWWRRQVRKTHGRRVEGAAIGLGIVHARAGLYASDEAVGRRKGQRHRNRQMLEACMAVNELGQEYTLAQLADLSVSNPIIRRGELMTRMAGFETVAGRLGYVGEFYTITCPSRMHARHSKSGEVNENYDGTKPDQAQRYLCALWGRARAALHRRGVRVFGFRVAEPHHDGTPHWHLLLFMPSDQAQSCREVLGRYALADSPNEVGARKHRIGVVAIDAEKGTATGYLAKYVAKNIDAFGVDRVDEDLTGRRDPRECAARVDAWASCWGIRQFQQVGGPPVTVWRELRRLEEQPSGVLEDVRIAADQGLWGAYTEAMGGPVAARKDAPVKTAKAWSDKPGRYGEPEGNRIIGLECGPLVVVTRVHEWRVEWRVERGTSQRSSMPGLWSTDRVLAGQAGEDLGKLRYTRVDFLARGEAARPWSSVNNCTGQIFDGGANRKRGEHASCNRRIKVSGGAGEKGEFT